ncbi:rhamnan synthesis F family protein [uncultured Roseobacter sp.]|uniref:rhamnan synthesis F family protein n=1 Tax=uncultured Roseobacter sp. TaxID=114847 RepID=UPI002613706C|nr:rhamnan synthesis F family protein [uncultured Roseobacter sp.]
MIPRWKLKRELTRLLSNSAKFPASFTTWLFGAGYYDFFLSGRVRQEPGEIDAGPRRAVYLMFPSKGLLASHERSLRYLLRKNIATTVVSNCPLSPADKNRVLALCHRYIERPNFGYDFGGYRDGLLSMGDELASLGQLVLLNDSSWFPITDKTDWLDQVEALNVDFAGAASNYGMSRPDPESYRSIKVDYCTDHPNFHYCSYALSFSSRTLSHPGFLRYWKKFPLSNSKKRTVRRGEIGLTRWAISNGLTHGATFDSATIPEKLASLEEARLRHIAEMLIIMDDRKLRQLQASVESQLSAMPKLDLIGFILTAAARKGVSYATAEFNIFECGFPFLKKSPLWMEQDTSQKTLDLLERLNTPASLEALFEARTFLTRL